MSATTNKRVLVARFDRATLQGFVQTPASFGAEAVELLTLDGSLIQVPYSETKAVCFVRDFESGETWHQHPAFATRPKTPGLWVRLRFRDGDSLEGMLANNLMQIEPSGFSIIPPDPTFHNQRIFVPRAALSDVQVLGVVGTPLRRSVDKKPAKKEDQLEMFEGSGESSG
ncbi:MAG: hypothetical protein DMG59_23380 [Acidobacteria bacterium]|nr:MAG: hypothetical protein DMG59_23380 [Acidobacteriota bacterium]